MDLSLNNLEWLMCHKTKPNSVVLLMTNSFGNISLDTLNDHPIINC